RQGVVEVGFLHRGIVGRRPGRRGRRVVSAAAHLGRTRGAGSTQPACKRGTWRRLDPTPPPPFLAVLPPPPGPGGGGGGGGRRPGRRGRRVVSAAAHLGRTRGAGSTQPACKRGTWRRLAPTPPLALQAVPPSPAGRRRGGGVLRLRRRTLTFRISSTGSSPRSCAPPRRS